MRDQNEAALRLINTSVLEPGEDALPEEGR